MKQKQYTHIIKNVYSDPAEVFDSILDNKEILARATSVTRMYDEFLDYSDNYKTGVGDLNTLKEKMYLAMITVNALEGLRFYVSFACSFAFGELKKMEGSAKIISLIARDETQHLAISQNIIKNWAKGDDPAMQDYVAFQISVRNSYNGVWSVMITADGFRLWCENGCTSADKIANYMQKHNGKFYYNFGHIEHLIDEFRSNEQRYREWYNTSITEQDVESMFNKLTYTPRATVDGKYRNQRQYDNLMSLWNEYRATIGKNKWGLYNTVTDWISHPQEVKDKHKTTVERNSKLLSYMNRPNSMFQ